MNWIDVMLSRPDRTSIASASSTTMITPSHVVGPYDTASSADEPEQHECRYHIQTSRILNGGTYAPEAGRRTFGARRNRMKVGVRCVGISFQGGRVSAYDLQSTSKYCDPPTGREGR